MVRRSQPDYAFKSKVLREHADLLNRQNKASYLDYCKRVYHDEGIVLYGLKNDKYEDITNEELFLEASFMGLHDEFIECEKINHAYYERLKRLKSKVANILKTGESLFLTLTFTDEVLTNTTPKQRRVAVSRYLKQYNALYIANIDFGKKNHREHYHALIQTSKVNHEGWSKYGAINFEKVRIKSKEKDSVKLSKYINKLANHAIKETTKRSALLYSR